MVVVVPVVEVAVVCDVVNVVTVSRSEVETVTEDAVVVVVVLVPTTIIPPTKSWARATSSKGNSFFAVNARSR